MMAAPQIQNINT